MQIARTLSNLGFPTTVDQSLETFMGLGHPEFYNAVAAWIGTSVPDAFIAARAAEDERVMMQGVDAVRGAVDFVRGLPPSLPRAIASSSSVAWIERHLTHIGLQDAFAGHIYSGREHVRHGKPAPDIYLHAARALGVPIAETLIIEDSVVGVTGACASGAHVVGLIAGQHCGPAHGDRLRAAGADLAVDAFAQIDALLTQGVR